MSKKILIAVNDFNEEHISLIGRAVEGLATIDIVDQQAAEAVYLNALQQAEICIGWPAPEWIKDSTTRFLQIGSSGWDNYQGKGLEEKSDFILCTGKGLYTTGVAEHAIAMMFALVRRIPVHVHDKDQKQFKRHLPFAGEIAGSSACVIGYGEIGKLIANHCIALGMRVSVVVRNRERHRDLKFAALHEFSNFYSAVGDADHIFLTIPAAAENRDKFSDDFFRSCKWSAFFYNVSRGSNVDEAAMIKALEEGLIAGAGLDVTETEPLPADSKLWDLGDNVLITGHSAGLSSGYPDRFCELVISNLQNYFNHHPMINRVI